MKAVPFSGKFDFAPNIPGITTGAAIEIGSSTDADVLKAIVENLPFPNRTIQLGRIAVETSSNKDIAINSNQGTVTFRAGASAHLGLGVFDKGSEVLSSLKLEDASAIGLTLNDTPDVRYMLFQWGYGVEGKASAGHPLGMLGSVTFGVEGHRDALYAVLSRFASQTGANTVLRDTVSSFRLPRHVASIEDLKPGTMLIAEVDGSIGISVATQLGYDFSFIREVSALGLTGDVGLKLELGLKAAVGFEMSGRYLVALDRESLSAADSSLRLRLFKLSKKGWNFGLNLSAKVQGNADILPEDVDDLVKAVFGIHGMQVVKELHAIEKWLDRSQDTSDFVAGLANKAGLDLLEKTTGINPETAFNEARSQLLAAIRKFEELPHRAASELWSILEDKGFTATERKKLVQSLELLAGTDAQRKAAFTSLLSSVGFADTPIGKLLTAASDRGMLSLLDRLEEVQRVAGVALDVVKGGTIGKLQAFLNETLNLDAILKAANQTDFKKLNGFLVARLSAFLDEELSFEKLDEVQQTIRAVLRKRQEIYETARQALTRRYDFELAYTYQRSTSRTALLDVTFDLGQAQAKSMLQTVLRDSNLDRLLTEETPGISLANAVLTHEITRQSSIQVMMPFYNSRIENLAQSLAKVRAVDDGGRVLFYELDAADTVTRRNRFRSQLAVTAALPVAISGGVRAHTNNNFTLSYRMLYARQNLRRADLEYLLKPTITEYFGKHFQEGGQSSFGTWVTDLDRVVEEKVGNGSAEFGDVLISLEVTAPGRALAAWMQPRGQSQAAQASMDVSRRLQQKLKRLLASQFFQNLDNLRQNAAAAPLLVWASIPPSTSVRLENDQLAFNTDREVYWDFPDPNLRRAMVMNSTTRATLTTEIARASERLTEAGLGTEAKFFEPGDVSDFQNLALSGQGDANLRSLLFVEAQIVSEAANALRDIAGFRETQGTSPSKAIERLAHFGESLTQTFNERIKSIYGGDLTRSLGTMLFLEASCALDPSLRSSGPNALLSLTVLNEQREFQIGDFILDKKPAAGDIAVEQRLLAVPS